MVISVFVMFKLPPTNHSSMSVLCFSFRIFAISYLLSLLSNLLYVT